jgi:hypothetical protein
MRDDSQGIRVGPSAPDDTKPAKPRATETACAAACAIDPRGRLITALTETIAAAMAAGDVHAARVAHEALGRLLAEPGPNDATVADLGAARAKRASRSE